MLDFVSEWVGLLPQLLAGLGVSLLLTLTSLLVGGPFGLLLALGVMSKQRVVSGVALVFVETGRAVPALVLVQLAFYGLPSIHITLTSFVSATAALGWIAGSFSSESFRSGIAAVPQGQREASTALGVSAFYTYWNIILPEGLRIALPSLMNVGIQIFQGTSLAYTIGVSELLTVAYSIGNQTFEFLNVLVLAGLIYAAIVVPATIAVRALELRMSRHLAAEMR